MTSIRVQAIVVAAIVCTAAITAGVLMVGDHADRKALAARIEEMDGECAELAKRATAFEKEIDLNRDKVNQLVTEIQSKAKLKEEHEAALAEVLARWRVLSEQRDRLDAARQQVQRNLDELYGFERELGVGKQ